MSRQEKLLAAQAKIIQLQDELLTRQKKGHVGAPRPHLPVLVTVLPACRVAAVGGIRVSKEYGRLLRYGGGFLVFSLVSAALLWMGLQPNEDGALPFLMNARVLAWASWIGVGASIIGLAASICAAIKAAKSVDAAIEAKNSTIDVIHNLKDAHYGGKIDGSIAKIKHIETLLKNRDENRDILLYILDYLVKDLSEIAIMINVGGDVSTSMREISARFQDFSGHFFEDGFENMDNSYLYFELNKIKMDLIINCHVIQKLTEGKANG